jgi:hypothetical protein
MNGEMVQVGAATVRVSPQTNEIAAALAKAQAEMKNPPKDASNPHYGSKYADLASVRDAVVPVLARHGLSVAQLPCDVDGNPALVTILFHVSGQRIEQVVRLRVDKPTAQGLGSALTYYRRYSLQSLAGVVGDDDDDGNAASQQPQRSDRRQEQRQPAKTSHERRNEKQGLPPEQPRQEAAAAPGGEPVTSDDVFNLLDDLGERTGTPTDQLVAELLSKFKTNPAALGDLTPAELASAVKAVRRRIAETPASGRLPGTSDRNAPAANPTATVRH